MPRYNISNIFSDLNAIAFLQFVVDAAYHLKLEMNYCMHDSPESPCCTRAFRDMFLAGLFCCYFIMNNVSVIVLNFKQFLRKYNIFSFLTIALRKIVRFLYTDTNQANGPCKNRSNETVMNMTHDAYISYDSDNNADRQWVHDILVPTLESNNLSVIDPERDFLLG